MLKVKQRNAWTLKIRFYIGEMFRGTSAEATLHAFPQRAGLGKRGALGGREGGGWLTCPHVMQHRLACAGAAWVQPAGLNHHAPICRTHQQQLAAYACAQRTSSLHTQRATSTVIILRQRL